MWDVHGPFRVRAVYASGVVMEIRGDLPNGVRFEGSEGWIFVARGDAGVTSSDPTTDENSEALAASIHNLAIVHYFRGDLERAAELYQRACHRRARRAARPALAAAPGPGPSARGSVA